MTDSAPTAPPIPAATITRLPLYQRALAALDPDATVNSAELAEATGVNPAQVRKDLSVLGLHGTRGVGYVAGTLLAELSEHTGADVIHPLIVAGMGNLGLAVANHAGRGLQGFKVVAAFDIDPKLIGRTFRVGDGTVTVRHPSDLPTIVAQTGAVLAVVATPPSAAQQVCDDLIAAGITGILNFSATPVRVAPGVHIRDVDLAQELQILAYHEHRAHPGAGREEVNIR
ncbi:redox-sensing transcriptional repressor Rex [Enemella sp. A6]|uniref:redox-sensing transcriptional repressor Rex n=1 Tax=Enemella sp. A6 TaxID=3440152 RepID=UPI003EB6FAD9